MLIIPCPTHSCRTLITVKAQRPSEIEGAKIECPNCGSITIINLSKIRTVDMQQLASSGGNIEQSHKFDQHNLSGVDEITLLKASLGKYRLGTFRLTSTKISLLFESKVHPKYPKDILPSMQTIDWQTDEEVENYITLVHEGFHLYQDLYLGFCNYLDLCRDKAYLDFITEIAEFSKNYSFKYPIDDFSVLHEDPSKKYYLLNMIRKMANLSREIDFIASPETTHRWIKLNVSSKESDENISLMKSINTASLLETQAAIGTMKVIERMQKDFKLTDRANSLLDDKHYLFQLDRLPEEYSAPLRLLKKSLPDCERNEQEYLTIVLADISLHIPPPTAISILIKQGVRKRNFNPAIRFIQCLAIMQNLDTREQQELESAKDLAEVFVTLDNILNKKLGTPNRGTTTRLWIEALSERSDFWIYNLGEKTENKRFFYRKKALRYLQDHPDAVLKLNPPHLGGPGGIPMIIHGTQGVKLIGGSFGVVEGGNLLTSEKQAKELQQDLHIRDVIDLLTNAIYSSGIIKCPWSNTCDAAIDKCPRGILIEELSTSTKCLLREGLDFFGIEATNICRHK